MKIGYWLLVLLAILVFTLLPSFLVGYHYRIGKSKGYEAIKPKFSPPNAVFGIVWPILYTLMSVSLWLAYKSVVEKGNKLMVIPLTILYVILYALNMAWIPVFFKEKYKKSLWILLGILVVALTLFAILLKVNTLSGALWTPLLVWLIFALNLNISVVVTNANNLMLQDKIEEKVERLGEKGGKVGSMVAGEVTEFVKNV